MWLQAVPTASSGSAVTRPLAAVLHQLSRSPHVHFCMRFIFLHGKEHVPIKQSCEGLCLRSVFAASGGLSVAVPSCTHLYAVPTFCLQLDIWYSED